MKILLPEWEKLINNLLEMDVESSTGILSPEDKKDVVEEIVSEWVDINTEYGFNPNYCK